MQNGKRIVVVLPAYNAERTLVQTLADVPAGVADLFLLVDDGSNDNTIGLANELAQRYRMKITRHAKNLGYGANQKTCYRESLMEGADVVVMLHPDYQYEPKLLESLCGLVSSGVYDVALGSRILGRGALRGGMPLYKYIGNRALTLFENLALGLKLSEYHTGFRAYSRRVLETVPFQFNSNGFIFDNQILVQCHLAGFSIGEISVPTKYFPEASSIPLLRSVVYGLGVVGCSVGGLIHRIGFRPLRPPAPTHQPKSAVARELEMLHNKDAGNA